MLAALAPLLAARAAGARPRLRRHELDARGRARRRAGRDPGRARRGGHALLRPHDAGGAQPRPHRPRERPAAVLRARRPRRSSAASGSRGEVEVVGDVMVDVAALLGPRAEARTAVLERFGVARGGFVLATAHRAGNVDDPGRLAALARLLQAVPGAGRPPAAPADGGTARRGGDRPRRRDRRSAARLPRLHRAAAQRARRPDRLGRRAEGGLPGRRPLRDAARDDRVDGDRRRPAGTCSSGSTRRPRSPRWRAPRRRSARRSTATGTRGAASPRRSLVGWDCDDDLGRRGGAGLLGPEPRAQLRGDPRLRARLAVRRRPRRAGAGRGGDPVPRAGPPTWRTCSRTTRSTRSSSRRRSPPTRRWRSRSCAPASTASSRSRSPRPSRTPSGPSTRRARPGAR